MQKRQSHSNSRNGCLNCKKKHIKCDEQGPPCANCIARAVSCNYSVNPKSHVPSLPSQDAREASSTSTTTDTHIPSHSNIYDGPRRILELELMHRWTTSTYKSLCSSPADASCLQVDVPRWALKHDYLLNGILAISALEIASCDSEIGDSRSTYIQAAMEYYDKASTMFRRHLSESSIDTENIHIVYMYSCLVWPINLAMPQPQNMSALSRINTLMDLSIGSVSIALSDLSSLLESPMAPMIRAAMTTLNDITALDLLNSTTQEVLVQLAAIVETVDTITASNSPTTGLYANIVKSLHLAFIVEAKRSVTGYCLSFPASAGLRFAKAVKDREAVALLILMHWAVLLDGLKEDAWWVMSIGQELVREISDILLLEQSPLAKLHECQENIAWARQSVALSEGE